MTREQAINTAIAIVENMRAEYVPRDTGNMADDALRYYVENGVLRITVEESIAPYVPYTNEPWLSTKWNGKPNPNEGWWQRFADEFARRLAISLRGELK